MHCNTNHFLWHTLGCIYMTEYDADQGALISSIQNNILIITLLLELVVILFSFFSSSTYAIRLCEILSSIRTVRDGDYFHKIKLKDNDELSRKLLELSRIDS